VAKKSHKTKAKSKTNWTVPGIIALGLVIIFVIVMNYHFIMTDNGFKMIKKVRWTTTDTFADTRDWGPIDWMKHGDLMKAMLGDTVDKLKKDLTQ
jgi:hypothetical protein